MAACRKCGSSISFTGTVNDKLMPVDEDGTPHFATCAKAERNSKPAPPDDVCLGCGSRDLERRPGQGPHHAAIKCRTCGQHRWLRKPVASTT